MSEIKDTNTKSEDQNVSKSSLDIKGKGHEIPEANVEVPGASIEPTSSSKKTPRRISKYFVEPQFTVTYFKHPSETASQCLIPSLFSCITGTIFTPILGLCCLLPFNGPFSSAGILLGTSVPFYLYGIGCMVSGMEV